MPDADDFDVEGLRALLRGEGPKPGPATTGKTPPSAARKTGAAASPGGGPAPGSRGTKRPAAKPAARGKKRAGR